MKDAYNRKQFNHLYWNVLFLLLLCCTTLLAQVERTKNINQSFSGKNIVEVTHKHGPIVVKKSTDGQVRLEAAISIKAKSEADAQLVLNHFSIDMNEAGNRLSLQTKLETKNWNTNNGRTKITFANGDKVEDIQNLKINYVLYIPKLEQLSLENKYEDIRIEDNLAANLVVKLYSGKLESKDIQGNLNLNLKYGKAFVGNIGDAEIDLYDSDVQFGNAKKVNMVAKYSDVQLGTMDDFKFDSYDNELKIGAVKGEVVLVDKYSNGTMGRFTRARMDIYDCDLVMEGGEDLQLKSKYSGYKIKHLNSLVFETSYDDDLDIETLGSLKADAKYSEFTIHQLNGGIELVGYDSDLSVKMLGPNFKDIKLDGKYLEANFTFPNASKYRLSANMTYGKIDYPESAFEKQVHIEKNNTLEIKGQIKGASEESPLITVLGYDTKVKLN